MRALASLALLACVLLGGTADAKRVVRMPRLSDFCPAKPEWSTVASCLRQHVKFTLVRDDEHLKIIDIDSDGGNFGGIYLYRFDKQQWALHGEIRMYQRHEILDVGHPVFGKHTSTRIDIGLAGAMPFAPDGENVVTQGIFRQRITAVCFDEQSYCMQMTTACDLLLYGKAYNSFRGTVKYENNVLTVEGDRTNTGPFCAPSDTVFPGVEDFD